MAIYKNREVTIVGPNSQINTPDTMTVQYKDGTNENVALAGIRFTEDEKKSLLKNYPSKYDNVETIKDNDVEAVRVGVAPSFDTEAREKAHQDVQRQKQTELHQKQMEQLKKEESAKVDAEVKRPTPLNAPEKK